MDLSFTGRGVRVTEDIRMTAERKLAPLERLEPRTTRIEVELINEHHPRPDGLKRVEAALRIPRKTFRAEAKPKTFPPRSTGSRRSSNDSCVTITAGSARGGGSVV